MQTVLKVIGVLFLIGLATMSTVTAHTAYLSKCSESWPKAEGVIKESEIQIVEKAGSTQFKAHVLYEFTVDGKKYTSTKINYDLMSSSERPAVEELVNRYPKGQQVSVYYQPDAPSESVLEPGLVQWLIPVSIVLCLISLGVPLFILVQWLRKR